MYQAKLYENPRGRYTKWYTYENRDGKKGCGGMSNHGHKGTHARPMQPGETYVLVDCDGPGIIQQIWIVYDNHKIASRIGTMWIDMYWDNEETPAVSAPIDDFFCHPATTYQKGFQNALFSSVEGRSYNCFIPMPFHKHAKIVVRNTSSTLSASLAYCVEVAFGMELPEDSLYFHTLYQPERKTTLGEDFEILPKVYGAGRYLGANIQVRDGDNYYKTWFGEGEVKIYLDGDAEYPTLVGTGTEDYILSGYGQPEFSDLYSGCTMYQEDKETGMLTTAFYRLHIPDPVYFSEDCRVTLQQMAGGFYTDVRQILNSSAKVKFVSAVLNNGGSYLEDNINMDDPDILYACYLREDYVSSAAYFYLDKPSR